MILRLRIEAKSFRAAGGDVLPVLGRIDLSLGRREIVALVGPSGCGKTTLLRIAGGLDTAYHGALTWDAGTAPRIGTVFPGAAFACAWRFSRPAKSAAGPDLAGVPGPRRRPCTAHAGSDGVSGRLTPEHAVAWHGTARGHRPRLRDRARPGAP